MEATATNVAPCSGCARNAAPTLQAPPATLPRTSAETECISSALPEVHISNWRARFFGCSGQVHPVEPCASEMCYTARPGSRNGEDRALKTEDNGVVNKRSGRTLYAGAVVGWVAPRNAPTPLRNRPIMTSQRNVPNAAEQCATPFSHGFTWLGPRAP